MLDKVKLFRFKEKKIEEVSQLIYEIILAKLLFAIFE